MWADITTLFSQLHKGTDAAGPVVGAGIIYIKREQLMKLIPTFRATNTSGPLESAKVLADFGRFNMGEIYLREGLRRDLQPNSTRLQLQHKRWCLVMTAALLPP